MRQSQSKLTFVMYKPMQIANYFIQKSFDDGSEMTQMKIVKLVYIAHGYYLGLTGAPLIRERIEAWPYGPVIPSLYHAFKKYGRSDIKELWEDPETGEIDIVSDQDTLSFLDKIWDAYGHLSGLQLSTLTHQKNTPWDKSKNKIGVGVIPNKEIQSHYKELIAKNN